ncbi:MAG: hypothetical protein ACFB9M_10990 [Myxococcota bacterium]
MERSWLQLAALEHDAPPYAADSDEVARFQAHLEALLDVVSQLPSLGPEAPRDERVESPPPSWLPATEAPEAESVAERLLEGAPKRQDRWLVTPRLR